MKLEDWKGSIAKAKTSLIGAQGAAAELIKPPGEPRTQGVEASLPVFLTQVSDALDEIAGGIGRALKRAPILLEQAQIQKRQAAAEKARADATKAGADASRARIGADTDIVGQWPSDALADRLTAIGATLIGSGTLSFLAFHPDPESAFMLGPAILWISGFASLASGLARTAEFTRRRREFFESKFKVEVPDLPPGRLQRIRRWLGGN